jgi:uncharacterized protein (DUF1697 family)
VTAFSERTMPVFVALYRGINVGGRHAVKMEALRAMHERLGHGHVRTYIQSGNVVFSAKGAAAGLARVAEAEFEKDFGFPARIAVVTAKRWKEFVDDNPFARFAADDPKLVHAGICDGRPNATGLKDLLSRTGGREALEVGNGIVYLHAPDGFGKSKFAAGMERAGGVSMTVRNWRTVEALQEMAGSAR